MQAKPARCGPQASAIGVARPLAEVSAIVLALAASIAESAALRGTASTAGPLELDVVIQNAATAAVQADSLLRSVEGAAEIAIDLLDSAVSATTTMAPTIPATTAIVATLSIDSDDCKRKLQEEQDNKLHLLCFRKGDSFVKVTQQSINKTEIPDRKSVV